ncbi:hypothetical protein ABZ478_32945 [Streptomyces sp. NPDC005706]|uniref:hypothetical protein n=1 Tax=Streptomyces sp. NPDC005706 TaxID=3157169 RepID=UPI003406F4F8
MPLALLAAAVEAGYLTAPEDLNEARHCDDCHTCLVGERSAPLGLAGKLAINPLNTGEPCLEGSGRRDVGPYA